MKKIQTVKPAKNTVTQSAEHYRKLTRGECAQVPLNLSAATQRKLRLAAHTVGELFNLDDWQSESAVIDACIRMDPVLCALADRENVRIVFAFDHYPDFSKYIEPNAVALHPEHGVFLTRGHAYFPLEAGEELVSVTPMEALRWWAAHEALGDEGCEMFESSTGNMWEIINRVV